MNEEEEEEKNYAVNFKYVIVQDVKDTSNYYRWVVRIFICSFINNSKHYINKVQKDKQWYFNENGDKTIKQAQEKIDKHISFSFTDALEGMEQTRRIVIIEIENTIWYVTKDLLENWEEPMMTVTIKPTKIKGRPRDKVNYHVYLRKFGLEFLEFICKTHDAILYTHLGKELTMTIIEAFQSIKKFINFTYIIWDKPFWKSVYKLSRPVKSLKNIIPENDKSRFIILDSESLSYIEKYEDIYFPVLPISAFDKPVNGGWKTSHNGKPKRMRASKIHRRQSSVKCFFENEDSDEIQTNLSNHWLFYLKQLLTHYVDSQ